MKWEFNSDRPIYAQLVEQITFAILSGTFPAGSKLPSVRDLAGEAAVNPARALCTPSGRPAAILRRIRV